MVEGGPIDVLTGDYLAELTMAILYSQKMSRDTGGYVGTFLKQVREVLASCVENNIKIVSNAGGLNPSAMAAAVEEIAAELLPPGVTLGLHGDAEVMLAGGAEFATTPLAMACFCSAKAMRTRNDEPSRASRPVS